MVETLDMTQWAPDGVSWCVVHDSFRKATAEDAGDDIGKLLNPPVFDRYTLYSVEDGKTRARPFVKRKDQSPQSSEGIIDSAQYAQGERQIHRQLGRLADHPDQCQRRRLDPRPAAPVWDSAPGATALPRRKLHRVRDRTPHPVCGGYPWGHRAHKGR